MDHQSVGLIARKIEASGIPTVTLGSCRDMMLSVMAPRSVFIDFPLGHPCGKPNEASLQKQIITDALGHLIDAKTPGEMKDLPYQWGRAFGWSDYVKDMEEMINAEGVSIQNWKPAT